MSCCVYADVVRCVQPLAAILRRLCGMMQQLMISFAEEP